MQQAPPDYASSALAVEAEHIATDAHKAVMSVTLSAYHRNLCDALTAFQVL